MKQEQLTKLQHVCFDLAQEVRVKAGTIPSFIQNDLQMMVEDEMITEQEAFSTLNDMTNAIESTQNKLKTLQEKINPLKEHYASRMKSDNVGEVTVNDLFPLSENTRLVSLGHPLVPKAGTAFIIKNIDIENGRITCIGVETNQDYLGFFDKDTLIIKGKWEIR